MFAAGFHAGSRNDPDLGVDVDVFPRRAQNLTGPARRQDQEFEGKSMDGFGIARDEFRQVSIAA